MGHNLHDAARRPGRDSRLLRQRLQGAAGTHGEFEDPNIRVYGGDTAVNTGYYTFSYEKDGATKSLPARYSFTLVKRDGEWQIVDHHSSAMPKPPQ